MTLDRFRKSSFCAGGGCVAVAHTDTAGLAVCSTVVPDAGMLTLSASSRIGFIAAVKSGIADWPESAR